MFVIGRAGAVPQSPEYDLHRQMEAFDSLPRQLREIIAHADVPIDAGSVARLVHRMPPRMLVARLRALTTTDRSA